MTSTRSTFDPTLPVEASGPARYLDSVVWAVLFLWVGVAMLAELPWGWFLVGVGVLILAAQFARKQMDAKIEGFWVASGIVFLAGGLWNLFAMPWPLAPILLVLLGAVMLGKIVIGAKS